MDTLTETVSPEIKPALFLARIEAHDYHQEFGYQDYIQWVKEDLKLSDGQGKRFLHVYDKFGRDKLSVENIGASALYLLSAPSTPESAREEAQELAESGETVTHAKAKELADVFCSFYILLMIISINLCGKVSLSRTIFLICSLMFTGIDPKSFMILQL